MTIHVKPTAEELESNAIKALEEAEKLETKDKPVEPEAKPDKPVETEDTPQPSQATQDTDVQPEAKPTDVDYKKKFVESSKEAQILHARNKKVTDAFEQANNLPEPTDDELTKEYTDWDLLSDFEKKLAKEAYKSKKRFEVIGEATKAYKEVEVWVEKVDEFIDDPSLPKTYPDLAGKEEEFKHFATQPTRRGVDFDTLVKAFSYDLSVNKVQHTGSMFETGTGGPNDKPVVKTDKIGMDEAIKIRKTDYNKYKELL